MANHTEFWLNNQRCKFCNEIGYFQTPKGIFCKSCDAHICEKCLGSGYYPTGRECPTCGGNGCSVCDGLGQYIYGITCDECQGVGLVSEE